MAAGHTFALKRLNASVVMAKAPSPSGAGSATDLKHRSPAYRLLRGVLLVHDSRGHLNPSCFKSPSADSRVSYCNSYARATV